MVMQLKMRRWVFALLFVIATPMALHGALANQTQSDRSYDPQLLRLAEIMGAVHYLRELCGAKDGQRWRKAISDIVAAEGTTALRRATIAKRFNRGYRGYRRTYRNCTRSAKATIVRFMTEATEISQALIKLGG